MIEWNKHKSRNATGDMTFAITFTSVINCVPYAIRHYAHNCLRDKNKLLAGAYLSAGTRGSDRHLLLTVLIQRLQIQFRWTFSDAKRKPVPSATSWSFTAAISRGKKGPTFSELFIDERRREENDRRVAVNRVKNKKSWICPWRSAEAIKRRRACVSQTFSRLKFLW